jgi:quercetin dioxygenase-like cupin family protein
MPQTEVIRVGAIGIRFLVEAEDSNGSQTVFEVEVPPGARVPAPHSHDAFEETLYTLEGVWTWTIDGVTTEVGPGEVVCIKRGIVHGFENRGDTTAKGLALVSPGVFGPDYFREVAEAIPDPERVAEVMRRHGLTPAV